MQDLITIGQLATRGGVADSTVRYYERKGLLRPESRSDAGYRLYGPRSVERLRFIRAAQASGLSLRDILTLLEFQDGELSPCADVKTVIDGRLDRVKQQLRDLRTVKRTLEELRDACGTTAHGEDCPVLQKFTADGGPK